MGASERVPVGRVGRARTRRGEATWRVLQWARQNGCPWGVMTCAEAAKGGHLEVLQWARQNGCPWDEWTCMYAAQGGHLDVLQWARQNGCPWDAITCSRRAARRGHLEARLRRGRPPGDAAVGTSERVPVERIHVRPRRLPLPPVLDRARVPGRRVTRGASPTNPTRTPSRSVRASTNTHGRRVGNGHRTPAVDQQR